MSQGKDLESANVVAFWSGKWKAAQQNYPVHELELLALVETLKRFRSVLHGTRFIVRTDHKALEYFMKQRNLSAQQHRWLDVLNEFDFEIRYIPGDTNGFADALSRIYSYEPKGVARAGSEFIDEGEDITTKGTLKVHPVYIETYLLSVMNAVARRSSRLANKPAPRYKETRDRKPQEEINEGWEIVQEEQILPELPKEPTENHPVETNEPEPAIVGQAHIKDGNGLLEVSSGLGVSFPECIENRYVQ